VMPPNACNPDNVAARRLSLTRFRENGKTPPEASARKYNCYNPSEHTTSQQYALTDYTKSPTAGIGAWANTVPTGEFKNALHYRVAYLIPSAHGL